MEQPTLRQLLQGRSEAIYEDNIALGFAAQSALTGGLLVEAVRIGPAKIIPEQRDGWLLDEVIFCVAGHSFQIILLIRSRNAPGCNSPSHRQEA